VGSRGEATVGVWLKHFGYSMFQVNFPCHFVYDMCTFLVRRDVLETRDEMAKRFLLKREFVT